MSIIKNSIKIKEEDTGQRLDKFLTKDLKNISRSQIQKMIKLGDVLVNKKKTTVHYFLKENDTIEFIEQKIENKIPEKKLKLRDNDRKIFSKIKIINDNDDFLIIEKPAGLLVHPTEKNETNTLVDWLVVQYPNIVKIGEDPARAGIVHRLDKDVSGLMIIPRTQDSFDYFKQQFKDHTIIKKYIALVYGEIEKDEDEIRLSIGRSKTKSGLFAAHPEDHGDKFDNKDKKAITSFRVLDRFINHTLLEIEIFTGRTHQIRVHMLAHSHPIVGDRLYINKKIKPAKISRIFLHASSLEFTDSDKKKYKFNSELPKNLNNFLKNLKNQ